MLEKQLIIIGGKGGVGRTTIAAALGLALARRGRRTLVAHVRCKQRLAQLYGSREVGSRIERVDDDLWAVNMNPHDAIREMGMMVLRFRAIYRAVLENRIVRSFLRAVPALEEYSMIGKAWFHTTETNDDGSARFDTVVFDGPATGHLISMLRIPQVILDAVPEGPLTRDARRARELLADRSRTGMWIVTLAEEMPASEAIDLYRAASSELMISSDLLVINSLYPDDLAADGLDQALDRLSTEDMSPEMQALVAAGRTIKLRREINRVYLDHLARTVALPSIELPHLFVPELTREQLDLLVDRIDLALGAR